MIDPTNYTERERELILSRARAQASRVVLIQALADAARRGDDWPTWAQSWLKKADQAALNVSWEDLYDPSQLRLN